jgi:hypothetical protein
MAGKDTITTPNVTTPINDFTTESGTTTSTTTNTWF